MKYLFTILSFLLLFSSCVKSFEEKVSLKPETRELVYLKPISAVASSFDATPDWAPPPDPMAAVDGNFLTRWSSNYTENQWIYFDLGQPKYISKIRIFWEAAYAVNYEIAISNDSKSWGQLILMEEQDGKTDELEFFPVQARFVKITGLKRVNPDWGISFWEFEVYGPKLLNPEDKPIEEVYPERKELEEKLVLQMEEPLPSPGKIDKEEFHKGVCYTSWSKNELAGEASDRTLDYLYEKGIRHIGIMVVWYQDEVNSSIISPDEKDTASDEALSHALNKAHSLGMKVMLKPHIELRTQEWRGDIIPSQDWFSSYRDFILHYADLAQKYNVELFCIGTELVNTTHSHWLENWRRIIQEIKKIYRGALVYCANWDEYQNVGFWNDLDFIGIDAYFPLTEKNDPEKEELISSWKSHAKEIEDWLEKKGLDIPVIFTEIGYCSADGTNKTPWAVLSGLPLERKDEQEQADCLEALLVVLSEKAWFKGLYWWNYFPQERYAPLGFTIRGKIAERVLEDWFKRLD